jgi:hypothetical protein
MATLKEESVIFRPNSELTTQRITTINRQIVFRLIYDDCPRYISLNADIAFIGLIHDDKLHVFKLTDGEITEGYKSHFLHITDEKIGILSNKHRPDNWQKIRKDIMNSFKDIPNFEFISYIKLQCVGFKNLDTAKQIITVLNADLHHTCPDFSLNIDYVFSLPDPSLVSSYSENVKASKLLLCLFLDNNCVSSLEIDIEDAHNKINISSKTNDLYQERKFNKLLRAVVIIIAQAIEPTIQIIVSEAINTISAYLMIHSFNAVYNDEQGVPILDKNSTYDEVFAAMKKAIGYIDSTVYLTDENIQNAVAVFTETIGRVNCGPLTATATAKGLKTRRNSKKQSKKHNKTFIKKRFKDDSLY